MIPKTFTAKPPFRRENPVIAIVSILIRVIQGEREIIGCFSTHQKGTDEVARIIAKDCGLEVFNKMPPWVEHRDGQDLHYGRDDRSFWFRLESWPLDGERG